MTCGSPDFSDVNGDKADMDKYAVLTISGLPDNQTNTLAHVQDEDASTFWMIWQSAGGAYTTDFIYDMGQVLHVTQTWIAYTIGGSQDFTSVVSIASSDDNSTYTTQVTETAARTYPTDLYRSVISGDFLARYVRVRVSVPTGTGSGSCAHSIHAIRLRI